MYNDLTLGELRRIIIYEVVTREHFVVNEDVPHALALGFLFVHYPERVDLIHAIQKNPRGAFQILFKEQKELYLNETEIKLIQRIIDNQDDTSARTQFFETFNLLRFKLLFNNAPCEQYLPVTLAMREHRRYREEIALFLETSGLLEREELTSRGRNLFLKNYTIRYNYNQIEKDFESTSSTLATQVLEILKQYPFLCTSEVQKGVDNTSAQSKISLLFEKNSLTLLWKSGRGAVAAITPIGLRELEKR